METINKESAIKIINAHAHCMPDFAFEQIIKRINELPAQKPAKKQPEPTITTADVQFK